MPDYKLSFTEHAQISLKKPNSLSTIFCTWLVNQVISCYSSKPSSISLILDSSSSTFHPHGPLTCIFSTGLKSNISISEPMIHYRSTMFCNQPCHSSVYKDFQEEILKIIENRRFSNINSKHQLFSHQSYSHPCPHKTTI